MPRTAKPTPTVRQQCLTWYRAALADNDRFNICATAGILGERGILLPTEIWDEIGLLLVLWDAMRYLYASLDRLREQWRRVCQLECEGDAILRLFPVDVENVMGNTYILAFHEHLNELEEGQAVFEATRKKTVRHARRLRCERELRTFAEEMWRIRSRVRLMMLNGLAPVYVIDLAGSD